MPTSSIDTFFACSLIVSVVIIATAFLASSMQIQISSMQDLNQQDYLRNIADHIVSYSGNPSNWGSASGIPKSFGLSESNSDRLYELDIDKITRLNVLNQNALSYREVFIAARLNSIALGVSITQMLEVYIEEVQNVTLGNRTEYTFQVSVSQETGPTKSSLRCYVIRDSSLDVISNETSDLGIGYVKVGLPTNSSEPTTLVVFARATIDERLTAFCEYSFGNLGVITKIDQPFLTLSPLNFTLNVEKNYPAMSIENVYALTYQYQSKLTLSLDNSAAIPKFIDNSPIVLLVQGTRGANRFSELTTYPQLPLDFGANFSRSEINAFDYIVTVNGVFYKLTLCFGDVPN